MAAHNFRSSCYESSLHAACVTIRECYHIREASRLSYIDHFPYSRSVHDSILQGAVDLGLSHCRHAPNKRSQMLVRGLLTVRFNHGVDFQPLAQFDLAFSRHATGSQIVDKKDFAQAVDVTVGGGWSLGSML